MPCKDIARYWGYLNGEKNKKAQAQFLGFVLFQVLGLIEVLEF
jgi:hypothetical protein